MQDKNTVPVYSHFINGEKHTPSSADYISVLNPATGEVIAKAAQGSTGDLDRAVNAARVAFEHASWSHMSVSDRSACLYRIANKIMEHAQELAILEASASGGTISRILGLDIPAVVDLFMMLAEEVKQYPFVENLPTRPLPEPCHTQVWREPVGVCGLITAWNVPLLLFAFKVAPALAAGNTVVIKPSEQTPTSTLRLVEILSEVLPRGVLNAVNGYGSTVGEAMSLHPGIDKISFTGSSCVGTRVQINAAQSLKRVTLELGGKGPAIVMPDADIELLAHGALFGVYLNSGQACESGTRLLVHSSIYDQVVQRLVELSSQIRLGDPLNPLTGMGPLSSPEHGKKVLDFIRDAKENGAIIQCGGQQVSIDSCEGGFFIAPTILSDVTNTMAVAREEIFGPVLSVIKFDTQEQAIEIANDSDYGLAAGIWTTDVVNAQKIAKKLQAGSIWINDWHMLRTDAPFGGMKKSGYGRELGKESLNNYVEIKTVSTAFERDPHKKPLYSLLYNQ